MASRPINKRCSPLHGVTASQHPWAAHPLHPPGIPTTASVPTLSLQPQRFHYGGFTPQVTHLGNDAGICSLGGPISMPKGQGCAEANSSHVCRSQVILHRGTQETRYLQPSLHKPQRHCVSLGRLLRKLRSGKDANCLDPVQTNVCAGPEQEEVTATAMSSCPPAGHLKTQIRPIGVVAEELNPQFSCPRGDTLA